MAEGGKEEFKISPGITEDEQRLLEALHLLGIKPRIGSVEDIRTLLHAFSGVKMDPEVKIDTSVRQQNYQSPNCLSFMEKMGKEE